MKKIWILCTAIAVLSSCVKSTIDEAAYLRVATVPMTLSVPMAEVDDDTLTRIEVDEKSDTEWTFKWEESDALFAVVDLDGGDGVQFSMDTYDEKVSTFTGTVYDANYNMRLIHPYESSVTPTGMLYPIDLSSQTEGDAPYMVNDDLIAVSSGSSELYATPHMKHVGAFMTLNVEFTNIVEDYTLQSIKLSGVPSSAVIDMTKSVDDDSFFESQTEGNITFDLDDIEISAVDGGSTVNVSVDFNILPFEIAPDEEVTVTLYFNDPSGEDRWSSIYPWCGCLINKKNETSNTIKFERATFNSISLTCDMNDIVYAEFVDEAALSTVLTNIYYSLPYQFPISTDSSENNGVKSTGWMQHQVSVIGDEFACGRGTAANQNMFTLKSISPSLWNSDWAGNHETRYIEDLTIGRYYYIRRANYLIDGIEAINNIDSQFLSEMVAQAKFLQAMCYVEMMMRYGSMPIVTDASVPDLTLLVTDGARPSLKEYVEYVDELLVDAIAGLPESYSDYTVDDVRARRSAAYFLRARLWLWVASPLFNKRDATDYAEAEGHEGLDYLNYATTYDATLWQTVADRTKEAIDYCEGCGYAMVYSASNGYINQYQIPANSDAHNAYRFACEKVPSAGNTECIFFNRRSSSGIAATATCYYSRARPTGVLAASSVPSAGLGPVPYQNMVNQYRKADGSLFTEDRGDITQELKDHYAQSSTPWDIYEPRLNASICFDNQIVYSHTESDRTPFTFYHYPGYVSYSVAWSTGYGMRKFFPDSFLTFTSTTLAGGSNDLIDINMRLPELYFIYAEALNELGQSATAIEWIKPTMRRGGLPVDTMTFPTDYDTVKEWIIREKAVELFAEAKSMYDLKRLLMGDVLAQTKYGVLSAAYLTTEQKTTYGIANDAAYGIVKCDDWHQWNDHKFDKKQYLWPIMELEMSKDIGWVQNPGYY